jgi:hypothetical protein
MLIKPQWPSEFYAFIRKLKICLLILHLTSIKFLFLGQADLLHKYGGVKIEDIKGMRAPFLQIGGDNMFDALERYGFYYDSSISTLQPSWPFTLEYGMEHPCPVPPCAEKSHPGIWEIPLTRLQVIHNKYFHFMIFLIYLTNNKI